MAVVTQWLNSEENCSKAMPLALREHEKGSRQVKDDQGGGEYSSYHVDTGS